MRESLSRVVQHATPPQPRVSRAEIEEELLKLHLGRSATVHPAGSTLERELSQ